MIGKQTKGRSFRGVLKYLLSKEGAEIVGGNMIGRDARELSSEFAISRDLRPKLSRVVYHASLSLPHGEALKDAQWRDVAETYTQKMGFQNSQYVAVKHSDTNHQHIHIVASRVGLDGKVVSESHDYRRSEKIIRGIEREYELSPVLPSHESRSRAPTSGELHKSLREGRASTKVRLQGVINRAIADRPSMSTFVDRMEASGVSVLPNIAKTGRITGVSFRLDGEQMKGSNLGRGFTWSGLQKRGVEYVKNRDFERLGAAIERAEHAGDGASRQIHEAGRHSVGGRRHREDGAGRDGLGETVAGRRRFHQSTKDRDEGNDEQFGNGNETNPPRKRHVSKT